MHWKFHLREGVKWHKGYGEVTSEDVVFSIRKAMNHSQFSPQYKKAIKINPVLVESHFNLGKLYNKLNLNDEAEKQFLKITKINPGYADAYKSLGYLYYNKMNNKPKAKEYFQQYLTIKPSASDANVIKSLIEK